MKISVVTVVDWREELEEKSILVTFEENSKVKEEEKYGKITIVQTKDFVEFVVKKEKELVKDLVVFFP